MYKQCDLYQIVSLFIQNGEYLTNKVQNHNVMTLILVKSIWNQLIYKLYLEKSV